MWSGGGGIGSPAASLIDRHTSGSPGVPVIMALLALAERACVGSVLSWQAVGVGVGM